MTNKLDDVKKGSVALKGDGEKKTNDLKGREPLGDGGPQEMPKDKTALLDYGSAYTTPAKTLDQTQRFYGQPRLAPTFQSQLSGPKGYMETYTMPEGRLLHTTAGVYTPDIRALEFLGIDGHGNESKLMGKSIRYDGRNAEGVPLVAVLSPDGKVLVENVECPVGKETEIVIGKQSFKLTVTEANEVCVVVQDIKAD